MIYLSTDLDCATAVESIKHARSVMNSESMKPHIASEHIPGDHYQSDDELLDCARNISNTIYHPTSTCR
ncbi:MAG: choline dehydrogenase, partial [Moorea sp. SIO2B7]|nr:choline dehydrogenase [Moorena sp. SIO2B7]